MNNVEQITYLMSGAAHLPYLLVSIHTLRRHYQGEIVVYAWPESYPDVMRISRDLNLCITARRRVPEYRGKNDQFLDKIKLMKNPGTEVGAAIYLDADTIVCGDISPLFDAAKEYGFAATQFCDWTTANGIIAGRISGLRAYPEVVDLALLDTLLTHKWPSVNGGVFACRPTDTPVLQTWYLATQQIAEKMFIADEVVLHAMQARYAPLDKFITLEGGAYNCSPKYKPGILPPENVVIWHFHGDSNVRPDKSELGFKIWTPVFKRCFDANVGGIREWLPACGNKWLKKLGVIA